MLAFFQILELNSSLDLPLSHRPLNVLGCSWGPLITTLLPKLLHPLADLEHLAEAGVEVHACNPSTLGG